MEEARTVIDCLDRIACLDQQPGGEKELLEEVRTLLHAAEAWTRREGAGVERAELALDRCRAALAVGRVPVIAR